MQKLIELLEGLAVSVAKKPSPSNLEMPIEWFKAKAKLQAAKDAKSSQAKWVGWVLPLALSNLCMCIFAAGAARPLSVRAVCGATARCQAHWRRHMTGPHVTAGAPKADHTTPRLVP